MLALPCNDRVSISVFTSLHNDIAQQIPAAISQHHPCLSRFGISGGQDDKHAV